MIPVNYDKPWTERGLVAPDAEAVKHADAVIERDPRARALKATIDEMIADLEKSVDMDLMSKLEEKP